MYFSHGESNAKGVAVVITNYYEANIINVQRDNEGRIVVIDIMGMVRYTPLGIYTLLRDILNENNTFYSNQS